MPKKKKWFKEFREILLELGCDDFTVGAFSRGAKINREFEKLTPKEAVSEHVILDEDSQYGDKNESFYG